MRMVIRAVLGCTVVGSLTVLLLSVWPGLLSDIFFIAIILLVKWVPIVLIVLATSIVIGIIRNRRRGVQEKQCFPKREALAIPILAFVALAMLVTDVPRQIAFLASKSAFDVAVESAPVSKYGVPFSRRLGVYKVDEWATDPRGGVYFRVHSGADGIGPDVMSYGFALKPNSKGSPFGRADYATYRLIGDWYVFMASNDWY